MLNEREHEADVNVSEVMESFGIPDVYIQRFNSKGQLIPLKSNTPIEEIIYKNNEIGKVEHSAFLKIQEKAYQVKSGYFLWLSPKHSVYYPKESKIVISEKQNDILINRAIGTNWDNLQSILIAQDFAKISNADPNIFRSTWDVRANPIFIEKQKEKELMEMLQKALSQKTFDLMQSGEDVKIRDIYTKAYLAGQKITLGNNPLSCPVKMEELPTAFKVFSGEVKILCCTCPFCGNEVEAQIYNGEIHCPPAPKGCGKKAPYKKQTAL